MPAALDPSSQHEEIVRLYRVEGYSAKSVAEHLTKTGFPICQITLLRYLKKHGLVKRRGSPGFCAKVHCKFCSDEFMRTNPRHKWCARCLPDQKMRYLLTKFGINVPQFDAMRKAQDNACAICERSFDDQGVYVT